jgi:metallo-beta-lactamase family protein
MDVSKELEQLISRSRGRPNKDLAKLADQLRKVMEKWDS